MPSRSLFAAISVLLLLLPGAAAAVGFEMAELPPPEGSDAPAMRVGIWYPSDAPPPESATLFGTHLSLGTEIADGKHPLVVISHGEGGQMAAHADTAMALAEDGIIAVVPEHRGDSRFDESARPAEWMVSRPTDLREVIDFMTGGWKDAAEVDGSRIGVYGFSAGGYTALVAAGALPDIGLAKSFCAGNPKEYACRNGFLDGVEAGQVAPALEQVAGDSRIGAIAAAAPSLGFAFGALDLAGIDIPVQIWSGALDLRAPHNTNGALVAAGLPMAPEVHVVERAGHFAFLAPCDQRMETARPADWAMYCVDPEGFDRKAFHKELNAELVRFFDKALNR
ncbi:prolyl oligopeptidase family serine peptidase [Poseidonocella sp. HB161398]|uniref:alpha/beta hydrolase family protein n=1 Tax=Poseidonocella sp. HB161398 TaxID=2320855 RepID=UPI0011090F9F|nr:prolyl oligopeptidase family serine peptidase [Poseidonocella sp. HB161398]